MSSEQEVIRSLAAEWDIRPDPGIRREEVLEALALRLSRLLEGPAEAFFQLMYRLDIAEPLLQQALADARPTDALALLVWDRQVRKILSRARYSPPGAADKDLKW